MSEALTLSSVRLGTSIDLQASPWETMILNFPEPRQRITSREHADKDGSEIIDVQYDNSLRTIVVDLRAEDKDNALRNIQSLETILNAPDLLIEYKPNGAATTSFSRALTSEKSTDIDFVWSNSSVARITMKIRCDPFWHGAQEVIAAQTLNPTPQKLTLANIKGDVKMPCTVEIEGVTSFGTNIRIGSRETPMSESPFEPIKDLSGTVLAGAYGGEASDKTVIDSFTSLTGEDTNINGIAMEDRLNGVAVGDGGKIFTTDDGWSTNSDIAHGLTSQNLNGVVSLGLGDYYACGNAGVILKSIDNGANWSPQASGISNDLNDIDSASTTVVWACSASKFNSSKIIGTTDGSTWGTQSTLTGGASFTGISAFDTTTAFAVRDSGSIRGTTDGSAWVGTGLSPTSTPLNSVYTTDGTDVFICGDSGEIWFSDDAGVTWLQLTTPTSVSLKKIKMQSANVGWAIGSSGIILQTQDGSAWAFQDSKTSATLNDIAVFDASNVNIGGDGFTVLDTEDGGTTWTQPIAAWALTLEYIGRYHVYARIKKSASGAGDMQVSSGWAGGSVITSPSVAVAAVDTLQTVYLGQIAIPATNVSPEAAPTPIVKVEGKLDAGSETWSSDVFWLIPADGETTEIQATATDSAHIITDSDKNAVNKGSTIVTWIGVPVFLRPGDNNIVISETAGIGGAIITVKYEPLYKLPVAS